MFLARLSSDLDELHSATYLGGTGTDESHMHGLDMGNDPHSGSVWLFAAGQTSSSDFPGVLNTAEDKAAQTRHTPAVWTPGWRVMKPFVLFGQPGNRAANPEVMTSATSA